MTPADGRKAATALAEPAEPPPGWAFSQPGLLTRVWPFAALAVVAEASAAIPLGPRSGWGLATSIVLLLVTGAMFALPWPRLPSWMPVLVPLVYTASVLGLVLSVGQDSGVGLVVLMPLVWTALFQRRWESGCIVIAIVAVEAIVSIMPVMDAPVVILRRVLLWAALGVLISVATHGLRYRARRSRRRAAALQEQLRELSVLQDRERIADDLKDRVIQRIFAAGLTLQGAAARTTDPEVRDRVDTAVADLDSAVRTLREAIFGLDGRTERSREDERSLRQEILQLCRGLSPAPELSFTGPVDRALAADRRAQFLDQLRRVLAATRRHARLARVEVSVSDGACLAAIEAPVSAAADGVPDIAAETGVPLEISPVPGGARLAWQVPLESPARVGSGRL